MDAAAQQQSAAGVSGNLSIDKFIEGSITCLRFQGTIDESFDGKRLASSIKATTLILDWAAVRKHLLVRNPGMDGFRQRHAERSGQRHHRHRVHAQGRRSAQHGRRNSSAPKGWFSAFTRRTAVTTATSIAASCSRSTGTRPPSAACAPPSGRASRAAGPATSTRRRPRSLRISPSSGPSSSRRRSPTSSARSCATRSPAATAGCTSTSTSRDATPISNWSATSTARSRRARSPRASRAPSWSTSPASARSISPGPPSGATS